MSKRYTEQGVAAPDQILAEFTDRLRDGDFAIFELGASGILQAAGTGLHMQGGLFAYTSGQAPPRDILTSYASPNDSEESVYEFMERYRTEVGPLRKGASARFDRFALDTTRVAGAELRAQGQSILGAFVLVAATGGGEAAHESHITAFTSRTLTDSLRFGFRDVVLRGSRGDARKIVWPEAATNSLDEGQLHQYSLHMLAGMFPPARKIHKQFGLRRRP